MALPTRIEECHSLIRKQAEVIEDLLARIAALEGRIAEDSHNSHKPPSSDGLGKKPAFPRTTGAKRGGGQGHKGDSLQMRTSAD